MAVAFDRPSRREKYRAHIVHEMGRSARSSSGLLIPRAPCTRSENASTSSGRLIARSTRHLRRPYISRLIVSGWSGWSSSYLWRNTSNPFARTRDFGDLGMCQWWTSGGLLPLVPVYRHPPPDLRARFTQDACGVWNDRRCQKLGTTLDCMPGAESLDERASSTVYGTSHGQKGSYSDQDRTPPRQGSPCRCAANPVHGGDSGVFVQTSPTPSAEDGGSRGDTISPAEPLAERGVNGDTGAKTPKHRRRQQIQSS